MITAFTVACSKTVNLGNFSSIRVESSITVAVPDGDDYATLARQAQDDLRELLEQTYKAQRKGE